MCLCSSQGLLSYVHAPKMFLSPFGWMSQILSGRLSGDSAHLWAGRRGSSRHAVEGAPSLPPLPPPAPVMR